MHVSEGIHEVHCLEILIDGIVKIFGNKYLFYTPNFSMKGQQFLWEQICLIGEIG